MTDKRLFLCVFLPLYVILIFFVCYFNIQVECFSCVLVGQFSLSLNCSFLLLICNNKLLSYHMQIFLYSGTCLLFYDNVFAVQGFSFLISRKSFVFFSILEFYEPWLRKFIQIKMFCIVLEFFSDLGI